MFEHPNQNVHPHYSVITAIKSTANYRFHAQLILLFSVLLLYFNNKFKYFERSELKSSCSCCSCIPDYGNVDEAGMMPNNINFMPNSMKIGQFVPPFEEDILTCTRRSMDISRA